jgi:hypothetical protein
MPSMTFDISFELSLGNFIGEWTFGNQKLQYENLEN